jgi:hypothetical protein
MAPIALSPRPPFSTWPTQFASAEYGFGWYVGRGILVTQATVNHGTESTARELTGWFDRVCSAHATEIERVGGAVAIHDWRLVRSYDGAVRVTLNRWNEVNVAKISKAILVMHDSPLMKMAVAGADLILSIASLGRSKIEIATSLTEVLNKYGVQAPAKE